MTEKYQTSAMMLHTTNTLDDDFLMKRIRITAEDETGFCAETRMPDEVALDADHLNRVFLAIDRVRQAVSGDDVVPDLAGLRTLPEGAVIIDSTDDVWQKTEDSEESRWYTPGVEDEHSDLVVTLPAIVLWRPSKIIRIGGGS